MFNMTQLLFIKSFDDCFAIFGWFHKKPPLRLDKSLHNKKLFTNYRISHLGFTYIVLNVLPCIRGGYRIRFNISTEDRTSLDRSKDQFHSTTYHPCHLILVETTPVRFSMHFLDRFNEMFSPTLDFLDLPWLYRGLNLTSDHRLRIFRVVFSLHRMLLNPWKQTNGFCLLRLNRLIRNLICLQARMCAPADRLKSIQNGLGKMRQLIQVTGRWLIDSWLLQANWTATGKYARMQKAKVPKAQN